MEELESLFCRAQAGDLEAYGAIVRRYEDMAINYAHFILSARDAHLAKDAVQEAFIEAFPILSRVYELAVFPGWFRRIVSKQCDRLTRGKRDESISSETVGEMPSSRQDPLDELEAREEKELVLAAVAALPKDLCEVITLFHIDDLSQKQVAARLKVPVTTVDNRLRTARKRLKKALQSLKSVRSE